MERREGNRCLYGFAHRPEYSGRIINVCPSLPFCRSRLLRITKNIAYTRKMVNHFCVTEGRARARTLSNEREREKKENTIWILFSRIFRSCSVSPKKNHPHAESLTTRI